MSMKAVRALLMPAWPWKWTNGPISICDGVKDSATDDMHPTPMQASYGAVDGQDLFYVTLMHAMVALCGW